MTEPKMKHVQYIVSAAARVRIGNELIVIPSVRHFDSVYHAISPIIQQGLKVKYPFLSDSQIHEAFVQAEQGFIDNKRMFLNRCDAWKVAEKAEQIRRRVGGDNTNGGTLYSENLY